MAVLSLGLDPSAIPGIDATAFGARIEAAETAMREAGFDIVPCHVSTSVSEAEAKVRECLATSEIESVLIGAGLRMTAEHTVLFERLVNLLVQSVPGVVFCFNTSPGTAVDALRRIMTR